MSGVAQRSLRAVWLGSMAFEPALELQLAARDDLAQGVGPPTLFLVEHPATLTVGRRGNDDDVIWSPQQLDAAGIKVARTPRGGQVTLHAPGQLVVYPVVEVGRRIRQHLVDLGEVTRWLLESLGVRGATFVMDNPGVWLGSAKMASIGVHISRGISVQGLALNLDVDPRLFGALVSCGMPSVQMANARQHGAAAIDVRDAAIRWARMYAVHHGLDLYWTSLREPDAAR